MSRLAVAGSRGRRMLWSAVGQKDCQSSGLAGSQPLYVSALNVNGLTLTTHTARLGKLKMTFNVKGRQ